jgi:GTP-binding protein HflX
VGFVRNLPHQLIEAFRSTLEEVTRATFLLHIVDSADPQAEEQIAAVRDVLTEIGAGDVPELLVLNKDDIADPAQSNRLRLLHPEAVPISAAAGTGLDQLFNSIAKVLHAGTSEVDLFVPYDRGEVIATLHRIGEVITTDHGSYGTNVRARIPQASVNDFTDLFRQ